MCRRLKLFSVFFAVALVGGAPRAARANEGGADGGGGGKGVLCNGKLRLLEVYEAEELHHLHVSQGELDSKAALKKYWPKLNQYFKEDSSDFSLLWNYGPENSRIPAWEQMDRYVDKRIVDIPEGEHLPLSHDATLPKLRPGCKIVQILELEIPHLGPFDNDWQGPNVKIKRDLRYWNMLDGENQALLRLHELLYSVQGIRNRARPDANSDDIRRIMGLIASGETPTPMGTVVGTAQERRYTCRDGHHVTPASNEILCGASPAGFNRKTQSNVDQEAFSYKVVAEKRNGQAGLGLYFRVVNGVRKVSEATAFLPGLTLKQFSDESFRAKKVRISSVARSLLTDETFHVEIHFGYGAVDFPYMTSQDRQREHPISIRAWHRGERPAAFSWGSCEPYIAEDVDPYPGSCRPGDVGEKRRVSPPRGEPEEEANPKEADTPERLPAL
jgi:hypothetical protein